MLQLNPKRILMAAAFICLSGVNGVGVVQAADQSAEPAAAAQPAAPPAPAFPDLMPKIRAEREAVQAQNREREARFRAELEEQRRLNNQAQADRNAAEALTNRLDAAFAANETRIEELNALLTVNQGNLGELFGVTRQVAGDALGILSGSLVNTQFKAAEGEEDRVEFMRRMSVAAELPNIIDLERIWLDLMEEMQAQGEVARYTAPVLQNDGTTVDMEVVRIASYMVFGNDEYLIYLPSSNMLSELTRQPVEAEMMNAAADILDHTSGTGYVSAVVDPTTPSGALLSLYVERPDWFQRIEEGEKVNYVIIAVGVIGVLVAVFQYVYLFVAKLAVSAQLKRMNTPTRNNALGRLLLSVEGQDGHAADNELPEVVELRISEAVLREIPRLERFQSFLRLAVAAGPLLGLIGTVIGMIITFESITASGSSDPKLMAEGIGAAMIATVLGLGIAIPLLFINAGLVALSKSVIHVLEEHSTTLLAKHLRPGH
jgi:biopolymer transport protein ExbB